LTARLILFFLALAWLPAPLYALPLLQVDGGGQLTSAQGVDVAGILYDVSFVEGSCAGLFDDCDDSSDFTFTSAEDALDASLALLGQVFLDVPEGNFGSDPNLIFGCTFATQCFANTPYDLSAGSVVVSSVYITPTGNGSQVNSVATGWDTSFNVQHVYATWSESAAPAPEPSSAFLLATGLAGLAVSGKRERVRQTPRFRSG
jgi:hypothetical protein